MLYDHTKEHEYPLWFFISGTHNNASRHGGSKRFRWSSPKNYANVSPNIGLTPFRTRKHEVKSSTGHPLDKLNTFAIALGDKDTCREWISYEQAAPQLCAPHEHAGKSLVPSDHGLRNGIPSQS